MAVCQELADTVMRVLRDTSVEVDVRVERILKVLKANAEFSTLWLNGVCPHVGWGLWCVMMYVDAHPPQRKASMTRRHLCSHVS